jgi:hypothetical protein
LLASLCSTLTVLASQIGGAYRFALEKQWLCLDKPSSYLSRERNAAKLLRNVCFDSFELFLRHWPVSKFTESRCGEV